MVIKIGIVEDQRNIRDNLIKRFSFFEGIDVVMEASNGEAALALLKKTAPENLPDIILMDIGLPGMSGIETTGHVKALYPDIEIMIQTVFEDSESIFKSIQAGASGYLLKDDSIQRYIEAIRDMHNGGAPITPSIANQLLKQVRQEGIQASADKNTSVDKFSISRRELEILKGIVEDLTEYQIGEQLFISPHTVRTHIKNIYKKLHVHSRASAVKKALQEGLVN